MSSCNTYMTNSYAVRCLACGDFVAAGAGILEACAHRNFKTWCLPCFNKSDNSGPEDRECGNRAYEESCRQQADCESDYDV